MIRIKDFLDDYNISARKLTYLDKYVIVDTDDEKYLLKMKDSNKRDIFDYLKQIRYDYYMPLENDYNDYYELYPYYEDTISEKYHKAKELVYALAILHLKTTTYVDYNHDDLKEIYEKYSEKIDNLMKYYLDLQDYLEGIDFLSPAQFLLITNISKFYSLLRVSKYKLDKWFQIKGENVREVLLINNVSLDNFRVGEKCYFLDYKNATKGLVVYDLVDFYKNEVLNVDFPSLFNFYNSKYQLMEDEIDLFLSLISIPEKIVFSKDNYQDTLKIRKIIKYIDVTFSFVSEEDKENQKTDE